MSIIIKKNGFYKKDYGLIYPENLIMHLNDKVSSLESEVLFKHILHYLCGISENSFVNIMFDNEFSFKQLFSTLDQQFEDIEYGIDYITINSWFDVWGNFGKNNPQDYPLSHSEGVCLNAVGKDTDLYALDSIPMGYLKELPFKFRPRNIYVGSDGDNLCGSIFNKIKVIDFLEVIYKELIHLKGLVK